MFNFMEAQSRNAQWEIQLHFTGGDVTARLLLQIDLTLDGKLGVLINVRVWLVWFSGVRFRLACGGGVLSLVWCALRVIGPGVACFLFPAHPPLGFDRRHLECVVAP